MPLASHSTNQTPVHLVTQAGVEWLGPTAKTMHDFALKHVARSLAEAAGVSSSRGTWGSALELFGLTAAGR